MFVQMNSADLRARMVSSFDEANDYFRVNFRLCDVIDTAQQLWKIAKPWVHVLAVLTVKTLVMFGLAIAFGYSWLVERVRDAVGVDEELLAAQLYVEELIDAMPEEIESVEQTETAPVEGKEPGISEAVSDLLGSGAEVELVVVDMKEAAPAKKRSNRSKKSVAASVTIAVDEV